MGAGVRSVAGMGLRWAPRSIIHAVVAIFRYSSADVGISEKVWIHYNGTSSWTGAPTTFVLRDVLQFGAQILA